MRFAILGRIFVSSGLIFLCVYLIYRIFYKKSILPTQKEDIRNNIDPLVIEWREKHKKTIGGIVISVTLFIIIIGMIAVVIPFSKDIKYIISDDYPCFEGEILNEVKQNVSMRLGQEVVISNGTKQIKINMIDKHLKKGEWISVIYLPNSSVGELGD